MGCRAWDMHKNGDGLPDFLCWDWEYSGALFIVEVKAIELKREVVKVDAIKRLTPAELRFYEQFGACPNVVYWWSEQCARRAIEAAREAVARAGDA